jgi:hypothetical protein
MRTLILCLLLALAPAAELARADGLVRLSTEDPPGGADARQALNADAADTTNADQLWAGGPLGLGLDGSGLAVGIWDSGRARATHQEFGGRLNYGDLAAGLSWHATHVAGTIGAAGIDPAAHGMAGNVALASYDWNDDKQEMRFDAPGLHVTNHSYAYLHGWVAGIDWGVGPVDTWWADRSLYGTEDPGFGKYGDDARQLDDLLCDHPHLLSVWAAANDRNDAYTNAHGDDRYVTWLSAGPEGPAWYLVPTTLYPAPPPDGNAGTGYDCLPPEQVAKNTLVVGAVHDITADPYSTADVAITDFSSWGPTDDGRVRPDVVANGGQLYSTSSESDSAYATSSGTSMAAPNASGSAALLIQHARDLTGHVPRSATTRALVIHTAFDAGSPGPEYAFGWGVMDAAAAARFLSDTRAWVPFDWVTETTYDGTEWAWTLRSDGTAPVKATLGWTDPAPDELPGPDVDDPASLLVHDLDLWIAGPDGAVFYPWTLDPLQPDLAAVRAALNHLDNVEQVWIDSPVPGAYTLHVGHTGDAFSQDFSLLVSGLYDPVPEPAGLGTAALAALAFFRRRR